MLPLGAAHPERFEDQHLRRIVSRPSGNETRIRGCDDRCQRSETEDYLQQVPDRGIRLFVTLSNRMSTMSWHENLSTMSWHSSGNQYAPFRASNTRNVFIRILTSSHKLHWSMYSISSRTTSSGREISLTVNCAGHPCS